MRWPSNSPDLYTPILLGPIAFTRKIFFLISDVSTSFFGKHRLPFSRASVDRVAIILGTLRLLADCCPGFWPRAWTFGTRRKRLRSELDKRVEMFLTNHYGPSEAKVAQARFKEYLKTQNSEMKSESLEAGSKMFYRAFWKIPINTGANTGVVDFEIFRNISRDHNQAVNWKQMDSSSRLDEDLAHAKSEIRALSRSPEYY